MTVAVEVRYFGATAGPLFNCLYRYGEASYNIN